MSPKGLEFKDYARNKPLSVRDDGALVPTTEVATTPELRLGSLFMLPLDLQVKLAVARYEMEPDFKLAIVGAGVLTKDEIIGNMQEQTDFGRLAVQVEMGYCTELTMALAGGEVVPGWPVPPKQVVPDFPDWKPVRKCIQLRMTNRVLFCENTTDPVTGPIAARRKATVHPVFQGRGFLLTELEGNNDIRANFVPAAKAALTVYVSGVGHGNYATYTGYQNSPILQVGQYDAAEVAHKGIHVLSCQTARDLGPDTIAKGAGCYAGYDESFYLVWDDSSTPVNEFLLFVDADATFDTFMANGATALQACQATIAAFNAAIAQVPGTAAASWLTYDRDHFRLHGNDATTIKPYRYVRFCYPLIAQKQEALAQVGEAVD